MRISKLSFWLLVLVSLCASPKIPESERGAVPPPPITLVRLPGSAFQALPTRDGAWIFASISVAETGSPGILLLKRADNPPSLARMVPLAEAPAGMVLTHDEKLLVAAAGERLAFLDVERLIAGSEPALLGYLVEDGRRLGRVYVNVTADDRYLFSSDERAQTITVVDLVRARNSGFSAAAVVGKIPVGNAPIDLAFSRDQRYLYTTSQSMPPRFGWPITCRPEGSNAQEVPDHSQGAIVIIDVERAKIDPSSSVVGSVPAGCNPVRLVLSPNGEVAYVSARGMDALLAFDTHLLLVDPQSSLIGQVPVGPAPVGIAVIEAGRKLIVTSSNRFATHEHDQQPLFVVDATRISAGRAAVIGTIPAGAFPRELRVSADGRTLLLTNFASRTLEIVELTRLPLTPLAKSDTPGSTP